MGKKKSTSDFPFALVLRYIWLGEPGKASIPIPLLAPSSVRQEFDLFALPNPLKKEGTSGSDVEVSRTRTD